MGNGTLKRFDWQAFYTRAPLATKPSSVTVEMPVPGLGRGPVPLLATVLIERVAYLILKLTCQKRILTFR